MSTNKDLLKLFGSMPPKSKENSMDWKQIKKQAIQEVIQNKHNLSSKNRSTNP